jgi:hypothetical protein
MKGFLSSLAIGVALTSNFHFASAHIGGGVKSQVAEEADPPFG